MKILVILAHPDRSSFCHTMAARISQQAYRDGHEVIFHDLYAEKFDPVMPEWEATPQGAVDRWVATHCEELTTAQGIVIVHPNWWGQVPAILKGWVDRVFRPGIAYPILQNNRFFDEDRGALRLQTAVIFNTCDTPLDKELASYGDPLDIFWRRCVFGTCRVPQVYQRTFEVVVDSTPGQRQGWLQEISKTMRYFFPREAYAVQAELIFTSFNYPMA